MGRGNAPGGAQGEPGPVLHATTCGSERACSLALSLTRARRATPPAQTTLRQKEEELELVAPYSRSYGRTLIRTVLQSESGGASLVGRTIRVGGWVKTGREAGAGAFAFLEVNDGTCFPNLQVRVSALGVVGCAGRSAERVPRCLAATAAADCCVGWGSPRTEYTSAVVLTRAAAGAASPGRLLLLLLLQIMVDKGVAEAAGATLKELVPTSTCVLVEGQLAETPPGTKQKVRRWGPLARPGTAGHAGDCCWEGTSFTPPAHLHTMHQETAPRDVESGGGAGARVRLARGSPPP